MSTKLSIRDLDLENKVVFIRVDFNVPLAAGGQEITSDKRIKASLPTIQYALEQGAGVVLASHLGRPKGKPNPEMSLKPVAKRLEELLGSARKDGAGLRRTRSGSDAAESRVEVAAARESALSRRGREERSRVLEEARRAGDIYVNDAFGTAHRAHASTVGIIEFMPKAGAGLLMDKELEWLGKATSNPDRPCIAILAAPRCPTRSK